MPTNDKNRPKADAGAATTAAPGADTPEAPARPVLPAPEQEDREAQKAIEATRRAATEAVEAAARAGEKLPAGNRRTVTGVDSALVLVRKEDGSLLYSAVVNRGQDVPAETTDAELERLEALGTFAEPAPAPARQTEAERHAARLRARG